MSHCTFHVITQYWGCGGLDHIQDASVFFAVEYDMDSSFDWSFVMFSIFEVVFEIMTGGIDEDRKFYT